MSIIMSYIGGDLGRRLMMLCVVPLNLVRRFLTHWPSLPRPHSARLFVACSVDMYDLRGKVPLY